MSKLYEREIKEFFEVAKIKMAGTSKDPKGKFGKRYDSHVKLNITMLFFHHVVHSKGMNFVAFLDCFILFLYYVLTHLQTFLHHVWYQKHYQSLFRTGLTALQPWQPS